MALASPSRMVGQLPDRFCPARPRDFVLATPTIREPRLPKLFHVEQKHELAFAFPIRESRARFCLRVEGCYPSSAALQRRVQGPSYILVILSAASARIFQSAKRGLGGRVVEGPAVLG